MLPIAYKGEIGDFSFMYEGRISNFLTTFSEILNGHFIIQTKAKIIDWGYSMENKIIMCLWIILDIVLGENSFKIT